MAAAPLTAGSPGKLRKSLQGRTLSLLAHVLIPAGNKENDCQRHCHRWNGKANTPAPLLHKEVAVNKHSLPVFWAYA
jgi:hypothetical protein